MGHRDRPSSHHRDGEPTNAAAMEAMFKAATFTSVVRLNDLGMTAMKRALRDFADTAQDADIAVVFYAGHGIEVAGVNYLIPIDAVLERDIDVQDEASPSIVSTRCWSL